ncbi:MAG: hypothetical protein ACP6IP_05265 [Candidatus Njordarchaeia archaeon]
MRKGVVVKEVPARFRDLFEKIKDDRYTLDNFAYVYRGIWTGVLRIFVIDSETIKEYEIEREALKPILRGKDIFPFYYRFSDKWVIYTNQEDFDERFPNVIKYLTRYKTILERRGAVWIHGKKWWELEDPLDPSMFELEKLVSPYTSNRNSFAFEEGKYYVMDSTIIVRFWRNQKEREGYMKEFSYLFEKGLNLMSKELEEAYTDLKPTTENLKFLLGLLNSDVLEFYLKLVSQRVSKRMKNPAKGRFYLYIPPYPNILPVELGTSEVRREIIKIVDDLSNISRRIDNLMMTGSEDKEKPLELEEEKNSLLANLNEMIFQMYNLNEEEIATIQTYVLKKR